MIHGCVIGFVRRYLLGEAFDSCGNTLANRFPEGIVEGCEIHTSTIIGLTETPHQLRLADTAKTGNHDGLDPLRHGLRNSLQFFVSADKYICAQRRTDRKVQPWRGLCWNLDLLIQILLQLLQTAKTQLGDFLH